MDEKVLLKFIRLIIRGSNDVIKIQQNMGELIRVLERRSADPGIVEKAVLASKCGLELLQLKNSSTIMTDREILTAIQQGEERIKKEKEAK